MVARDRTRLLVDAAKDRVVTAARALLVSKEFLARGPARLLVDELRAAIGELDELLVECDLPPAFRRLP